MRRRVAGVLPLLLALRLNPFPLSSISVVALQGNWRHRGLSTSHRPHSVNNQWSRSWQILTSQKVGGTTARQLFFRATDANAPPRKRRFDPKAFEELKSPKIELPCTITYADMQTSETDALLIRVAREEDLQALVPMCIDEFGTGSPQTILDFPIQNLRKLTNWWDRLTFSPYVSLALRSKMSTNFDGGMRDPAMLVLCRIRPNGDSTNFEEVVGMAELSLQPADPNKNPPAFPIPSWIKQLYCQITKYPQEGWVTNVLIEPRFRGLGYAKLLMAATEGIAKSWGCAAIFLHADADFRSGKAAQALYKGLGYEVVTDNGGEFAWMADGGNNPFSTIRVIEGVPLLCFSKKI